MNDDVKSKLKEKFGALVTDEQLDKVAGGSYEQNLEILFAMASIDPDAVQKVFAKVNGDNNHHDLPEYIIKQGAEDLIRKHFNIPNVTFTEGDNWYHMDGQNLSHAQMLKMINDKANAARG